MCYKPRPPIGKGGGGKIPAGLDYDRWCGPAPRQLPLGRKSLHYDWHWIYDYGNGDLGNQGIHEMDMARWFLGYNEISPRVLSIGGRLGYDDDGQTSEHSVGLPRLRRPAADLRSPWPAKVKGASESLGAEYGSTVRVHRRPGRGESSSVARAVRSWWNREA